MRVLTVQELTRHIKMLLERLSSGKCMGQEKIQSNLLLPDLPTLKDDCSNTKVLCSAPEAGWFLSS